jgi:hypothetical protein
VLAADWQDRAETEGDLWVCTLCGEAVPRERERCPGCGTPRTAVQDETGSGPPPRESAPSQAITRRDEITSRPAAAPVDVDLHEETSLPNPQTFLGDDLVRRALLSGIFGLLGVCAVFSWAGQFLRLMVFFTFYSFWLLAKIFLYPGELSDRGMRQLYATFAVNGVALFLWLVLAVLSGVFN